MNNIYENHRANETKFQQLKRKKNLMKIMKLYVLSYIINETIDAKFSL